MDLSYRIAKHRAGEGSALLRSANRAGVSWHVVRVWKDADLEAEKLLKAMGARNLCPVCNAAVARRVEASRSRASVPV